MTLATARLGMVVAILASGMAHGQTAPPYTQPRAAEPHQPLTAPQATEELRHMIVSVAPPTAQQGALLHGMGDAAARQITEFLRGRAPLSAREQRNVIDMVHMAFEAPAAIMRQPDRTPKASLALLQRIGGDLRDSDMQGRLVETQQFVTAASAAK